MIKQGLSAAYDLKLLVGMLALLSAILTAACVFGGGEAPSGSSAPAIGIGG